MKAISALFKSRELSEETWVAVPEIFNWDRQRDRALEGRIRYVSIGSDSGGQWKDPRTIEWRPKNAQGREVSEIGGQGNHISYRES